MAIVEFHPGYGHHRKPISHHTSSANGTLNISTSDTATCSGLLPVIHSTHSEEIHHVTVMQTIASCSDHQAINTIHGYLMNTYTGRNEGFRDLIELFMTTLGMDSKPPCLKEKVHILLTGKYLDCIVLDNGNRWRPAKKLTTSFRNLLGDKIWGEFEAEIRSVVHIHIYRESDIPNRHGNCNSNPYLPNELRKRLGMALLPESKKGGTRRRKRVS